MVRSSLLLVPLVAVVGVWLGRSAESPASYVWATLLGTAGALVVFGIARDRARALSRAVNAWMGKTEVQPVEVGGGVEGQQLATAINSLGAAYARRGQRLEAQVTRLDELVHALPEPSLLFDDDLSLLAANAEARQVFHATRAPGEATATTALGSAGLADMVRRSLADGLTRREVARVGSRTVEAVTTRVDGQVLLLARDLSESVRVDALRRDFVANASHELKTPVAGIQSLADALDHVVRDDPARAATLVSRIRGEADRLSSLVSDLLSLRRVDEEVAVSEREVVDVERTSAEVIAELATMAREADVSVGLSVVGDPHVEAVAEDVRLVVGNLVENAIRYNRPGGEVSVTITAEPGTVAVVVADTGIGIPGRDLERVFERFYRVDPGRSRAAGGTGLGLSIVRHAVERNGGRVRVESLLGQGSTFTVRLPAAGGADDPGGGAG